MLRAVIRIGEMAFSFCHVLVAANIDVIENHSGKKMEKNSKLRKT